MKVTGASIVVVGTGTFATAVCRALARSLTRDTTVHVLGRTSTAVSATCALGSAHARLAGAPVKFRPVVTALHLTTDLRPLLAQLSPDVVVVCASLQPPAESRQTTTQWSALLRQAGFGVTVPLQAALVERIAADYADVNDSPILLNACFPDAVNPLLSARGLPVLCGIGNVAALALGIQDRLEIDDPHRVQLLAHHAHLHRPDDPSMEARAWVDGQPLDDVADLLTMMRTCPRDVVNEVSAWAAGPLITAVINDEPYVGHLPGPLGLPGGYPVLVTGRSVTLRLPPGTSPQAAVDWNQRAATLDGVQIASDGCLTFTPAALAALHQFWPQAPGTVAVDAVAQLRADLLNLRAALRRRTADGHPESLTRVDNQHLPSHSKELAC
ncbi:hypothetical protein AB0368_33905 [Actinoplanes sp. NPDC051475]|uniref:hypothetical protein n=1 Tax=Actinoplanes sp. NPDC051475 TaxID=3157225 RepID=UPI00344E432C